MSGKNGEGRARLVVGYARPWILVGRRCLTARPSAPAYSLLTWVCLGWFALNWGSVVNWGSAIILSQNGAFEGAPGRLLHSLTTCARWLNWGSYELGIACRR